MLGAINGGLVVVTQVPDIVVTLATSFICAGSPYWSRPVRQAAPRLTQGFGRWVRLHVDPKASIVLILIVAVIWIPLRRSKLGLSLYAIGSNRLAAFRSGISVDRTKFLSYVITGFFGAFAGLSLVASTGIGTPVPEATYVLIASVRSSSAASASPAAAAA